MSLAESTKANFFDLNWRPAATTPEVKSGKEWHNRIGTVIQITVSSNVFLQNLKTEQERLTVLEKMKSLMNIIESGIEANELTKLYKTEYLPEVEYYKNGPIEIGNRTGEIHFHSIVKFKGPAHVDNAKLDALVKTYFPRAFIRLEAIKNNVDAILQYNQKTLSDAELPTGSPPKMEDFPPPAAETKMIQTEYGSFPLAFVTN